MRWLFFALIVAHGLVHLLGFATAFDFAELPRLDAPISRAAGIAWLTASLALFATGALLILAPRIWWAVGLAAVVLSQIVIVSAWSDARFGTIANVVILAGVVYGFASQGPLSLQAKYRQRPRRARPLLSHERSTERPAGRRAARVPRRFRQHEGPAAFARDARRCRRARLHRRSQHHQRAATASPSGPRG